MLVKCWSAFALEVGAESANILALSLLYFLEVPTCAKVPEVFSSQEVEIKFFYNHFKRKFTRIDQLIDKVKGCVFGKQ